MLPDNEVYLVFNLDEYDCPDILYGVFTSEYLAESYIKSYQDKYGTWIDFRVVADKVNQMEV